MKRTPLKRSGKRLHVRTVLLRRSPLRRSSSPLLSSARSVSVAGTVRTRLAERSGGWCEIRLVGMCRARAVETSHRVNVKVGGRHGDARRRSDRLSNVVHSCSPCHRWVHLNPRKARDLYGLQVREGRDTATVPLLRRGELVYLDDFGGVHPYEQEGA
jgi:hypothetical protein